MKYILLLSISILFSSCSMSELERKTKVRRKFPKAIHISQPADRNYFIVLDKDSSIWDVHVDKYNGDITMEQLFFVHNK